MVDPAMQERQAAWPDAIRSWWLDVGLETLQDQGIKERHYQNKNTKERLLDAMAVPNILALIEHARSMEGTDEDEVVKRLGLDPCTPNRWWKNEVQVHPRTFFGLLVIGLREEIHKIHFPSNRDVILEAVSRTVAIIREKECGGDRRCPTREELACVKLLVTHPHSDVLLGHHRNVSEEDIFKAVLRELRKRVPTRLIGSVADVRTAAAQWLRPYLLFRIGLLLEWGFLDGEAV
jgi:hypothetical protein